MSDDVVDIRNRCLGIREGWHVRRRAEFRAESQLRPSACTRQGGNTFPPTQVGLHGMLPLRRTGVRDLWSLGMADTCMNVAGLPDSRIEPLLHIVQQ